MLKKPKYMLKHIESSLQINILIKIKKRLIKGNTAGKLRNSQKSKSKCESHDFFYFRTAYVNWTNKKNNIMLKLSIALFDLITFTLSQKRKLFFFKWTAFSNN